MRPVITDGRLIEILFHTPCLLCFPFEEGWSSKKHEPLLTSSLNHTDRELVEEMSQKEKQMRDGIFSYSGDYILLGS